MDVVARRRLARALHTQRTVVRPEPVRAQHLARGPRRDEESIFDEYGQKLGLPAQDRAWFRDLALASAAAVLRGHYSLRFQLYNVNWTRDQFIGGSDKDLTDDFLDIYEGGLVDAVLAEKAEAVRIWTRIDRWQGRAWADLCDALRAPVLRQAQSRRHLGRRPAPRHAPVSRPVPPTGP